MASGSDDELRVTIGPTRTAEFARVLPWKNSDVLTAPLGIERLAARRLRAWIARRGTCPVQVIAYGRAVGALAAKALPTVDRLVYAVPPERAAIDCQHAARVWAQREALETRSALRESLGISNETFVVLAGGDWCEGIDARDAFGVVGKAALAGADVALVVSSGAQWVGETRRFARGLQMSHRFIAVDGAEVPSALWGIADVMMLLPPTVETQSEWWGHCVWWAHAAQIQVIAQECALSVEGTIQVAGGDRSAMTLALLECATPQST